MRARSPRTNDFPLTAPISQKPKVERLTRAHDRTSFESGATELDEWLRKYSWQNQRANHATTYVASQEGRVIGYYAITVAGIERSAAPESISKGAPASVPCFLLARLAIDQEWQGNGLGWGLLRNAMRRSLTLLQSVAAAALLVHARDDAAREFYSYHAEFEQSPIEPLHLLLPMKKIAARYEALKE